MTSSQMQNNLWNANSLRSLRPEQLQKFIRGLTNEEAEAYLYDWSKWCRDDQQEPAGHWVAWLVLAGRGYGKTRVGAEWVRKSIRKYPIVNIIGATSDDARDIMIEGESGLLAICPNSERPRYLGHKSRLEWPNGARSLIFTADAPERLRGKQHMKLWADEACAWRYRESWDQAMFGLRLGDNPQVVVTTTPKPTKMLKEIMSDPNTAITRGSTYQNRDNLAPKFYSHIIRKYEGTRLGRQEVKGEVLEDNPNALWTRDNIDAHRISSSPCDFARVVIGVDPAVTADEDSDETGIVVCARGTDGRGYVLADFSMSDKPEKWARKCIQAFSIFQADRIIAEVNNGGDLVESVIRTVSSHVPYTAVRATRGKAIRAEPIASLYEQGLISHVGSFAHLEDQLCDWDPTVEKSPDRLDALVWAFTYLFESSGGDRVIAGDRVFSSGRTLSGVINRI